MQQPPTLLGRRVDTGLRLLSKMAYVRVAMAALLALVAWRMWEGRKKAREAQVTATPAR